MSQDPNKLLREFLPQVETACREGRGEDLLFAVYKRQAEIVADGVYLILQQTATEAETDPDIDPDRLLAAMQDFSEERGRQFLECVAETCVSFGLSRDHQVKAETVTADAFRERLNLHFTSTGWGGSA